MPEIDTAIVSGFISGAGHWESIIKEGNGKCFYDVNPWDISETRTSKTSDFSVLFSSCH
ncbi:hypothetical protein Hdeb2414_s0025g00663041 [Helianthus debilis subsp. tardiflorus]